MTIKQHGGVFGRNPTFNDVTIDNDLDVVGYINFNSDAKIRAFNGDLIIGTEDTALRFDDGDDAIFPVNVNTGSKRNNSVTIGASNAQIKDIYMGGNLIVSSGSGIDFSATAGTGTSELLDDYEEGVWTPTGAGAGAVGVYTKMGDTVFAYCEVKANSVSTNTISGLPFTAGAGNSAIGGYFGRARFAGIFDANGNEVRIRILGTDIKFMTNGGLAGDASATITTGGGGIVQLAISLIYKV